MINLDKPILICYHECRINEPTPSQRLIEILITIHTM